MLGKFEYQEKDQNIYAGFISLAAVLLVIGSYVLHILADQDNWTQEEQSKKDSIKIPKNPIEIVSKKESSEQTNNSKQIKNDQGPTQRMVSDKSIPKKK